MRVEKLLGLLIGASLAASVSTALLRDDGAGTALPPTPTPTFSESPFPSATETLEPVPSDTASPSPTDTPTDTPSPTDTALPGPTDTPTETPSESPEPEPTDLPTTSAPTPTPTSTVKATLPKTGVGSHGAGWLLLLVAGGLVAALPTRPRAA